MIKPSELSDHLGYWLRAVSNYVSHAFALRLADKNVTVAEWVMLRSLFGRGPIAPSRLAADMGMTRGAITKLADRLMAKRLLERTADAEDARAQTLALTTRGSALVPELAALADANDAACFAELGATERRTLEALLRRVADQHRLTLPPTD